jgi:thiamine biosynthesis lipoprotein
VTDPHRFQAMGCEVVVAGATRCERRAIERLFTERDRRFSRFIAGSELNRVNRAAGRPVRVSREFAEVLELALAAAAQTDGLVDPTLGRAVEAAGYDRDFVLVPARDSRPPGPAAPSALASVRLAGRLLMLPPRVRLDLNGVVKGKTVDDALELVGGDGFVSAGGDIAARGGAVVAVPGGAAVRLVDGALATSGQDRRTWRRGREVQHHLIDPATGRPARSPWQTVTVCAASCVGADIGAKAGFLLAEQGPERLDEWGLAGSFVDQRGEVVATGEWLRQVEPEVVPCT